MAAHRAGRHPGRPVEWDGAGFCGQSLEQQFEHFVYPAEGCSEIKLWYRYGGSFMGTMSDTTKWVRMYQSPKLEFVVNQDIWYNSETRMADVILPACTNFERDDIGEFAACDGYTTNSHSGNNYRVIVREKKCIEPLWESRSDYQILAAVARAARPVRRVHRRRQDRARLGQGLLRRSDLAKTLDWENFDEKGYHIINAPEDYKPTPCLRWFAEGRACDTPDLNNPKRNVPGKEHELGTYSGKIEFSSESLKAYAPDDEERPVSPAVHRELGGPPHDRALREVPAAAHVAAPALLVPLPLRQAHRLARRHPRPPHQEGRLRVVAGAHATRSTRTRAASATATSCACTTTAARCSAARSSPSASSRASIHSYASSAKYDPLEPGKADSIDKGGCVNMLTRRACSSKHAPGMTPNSCLIEVEKWEG